MVTLSLSCLILSLSPEEGDQEDNRERQEKEEKEEDEDVLDRQKCQAALASLRHAKWFQVRTAVLMTQSFCVFTLCYCYSEYSTLSLKSRFE